MDTIAGSSRPSPCCFSEDAIKCSVAAGLPNAKARQKELFGKLKPLLWAGRFAAVQARALWSTEERIHLRPGHFWACELGDADGNGSPILHQYTGKNEWFELKIKGAVVGKYRGDDGECLLLLRCYYNRVADDPTGLTFVREARDNEVLVVNSSELRAVQGRQACDFQLHLICMRCKPGKPCAQCKAGKAAPQLRASLSRAKKQGPQVQVQWDPKQRWALHAEIDCDTRRDCVGT